MTLRYVRSGAGGAATGADWANAYLTLGAGIAAAAAGDTIYVSEDHNESSAAIQNYTSPGTRTNPLKIICVDHTGSVPPVAADFRTTGTVATTGANSINFNGADTSCIVIGVVFIGGSSTSNGSLGLLNGNRQVNIFKNCTFQLRGSSSSGRMNIGVASTVGGYVEMDNCTVQFANASQQMGIGAVLVWKNTTSAIVGATLPTTLAAFVATTGGAVHARGVDFSALGSGKTLFDDLGATAAIVRLLDCKIDAAVTLLAAPTAPGRAELSAVRVSADGTNYRQTVINYMATLTEETTIVRTGGASNGTTTISWKVVTTANPLWTLPFECPPIAIWNDTTGSSVTATIECRGAAIPNDDEAWLEVEYLGSSGSPQASFVNDSKSDILASGAAQTSSSESWGGSTASFKLNVSFTPQQKGWIFVRVKIAKASSTFYIDPKVTLT